MAIPVSRDDARRQLRMELSDNSRNDDIDQWIADAAGWVERYTGHILSAREVTETLDGFGRGRLKAWPVAPDATVTVSYGDAGQIATTITGARLMAASRPAAVLPPRSMAWPAISAGTPVTVIVRAGYEAGDDMPRAFRRAMLVLITGYEDDPAGGEVAQAAEASAKSLCRDYRFRAV